MRGVTWLFFDMGSTLVDERLAYAHRIRDMIRGSDVSYVEFYKKMIDCYLANQKGDSAAGAYYHLTRTPWHSEDEFLYDDAIPVLRELSRSYSLGILANQPAGTAQRMERYGIRNYFKVILSSEEEGLAKPDPELFRRALRRAGCVPEQAAMIGDRLDNDIRPAKALGMRTIWVRQGYSRFTHPADGAEQPDYTVRSLTELATLVRRTPPASKTRPCCADGSG